MKQTVPAPRASRAKLLLIMAVFAAPMLAAALLVALGWQPGGRGHGLPVLPQRNFAGERVLVTLADGRAYPWRDVSPRMTLVALAGPDCATRCLDALTKMAAARVTLNQNAPRLRLLYVGRPPVDAERTGMTRFWQVGQDTEGRLTPWTPKTPDSVGALLVESDGTVLAYYPPGFDPTGLRQDLQKVIR